MKLILVMKVLKASQNAHTAEEDVMEEEGGWRGAAEDVEVETGTRLKQKNCDHFFLH